MYEIEGLSVVMKYKELFKQKDMLLNIKEKEEKILDISKNKSKKKDKIEESRNKFNRTKNKKKRFGNQNLFNDSFDELNLIYIKIGFSLILFLFHFWLFLSDIIFVNFFNVVMGINDIWFIVLFFLILIIFIEYVGIKIVRSMNFSEIISGSYIFSRLGSFFIKLWESIKSFFK